MPDLDDSAALAAGRTNPTENPAPSRRFVLKGAAGAGAAGIAATAFAGMTGPALAAARTAPRTARSTRTSPADESADDAIVVHVRDAASGEIDIFRGTSQTRLHDRALAAHLVRASR
jgi:anaerobic selenocysteine-containing dehydrogenase